ncbi:hypothetical protein P3X46_014459 [Hevea brasiliensis]|uniref:Amino acid transporter transmembrane domain-containing protein n=1 Tax=Hevea brasiliensis TaxID=3981 RepID=A0ABQ9M701_HEVBR|nr:amino acid transporter AVT6C [Hevea brasiliensis]KAJ9175961.1 hypothetical protein P3X46_014459 [Hevea brasiliensis]
MKNNPANSSSPKTPMKQAKNDTGLIVPLLPEVESSENQIVNGASISGAVLNISTTMIGAGIMSVPATIKVLGIIPGFILLLIVAFFVEVTVEFMLRYTQSGQSSTYAGLMGESFGTIGSIGVQLCVIITNLGCLIIYLIIIGDVLCGNQSGETMHLGILQEWFGIHWWNSRAYALLFLVLIVMLPLVLLRRVDSLKFTSGVSILLALVFVAISSAMAVYAMWQGKTQKLRLFPDFANQASLFDLFTTIPVFVTGLGFHVNVHPIRSELGKPSDMNSAVRISLIIGIAIYFAIGFFGYLLFGDSIMPDILVNFDQNSDTPIGQLLNDSVRLSYAIHLVFVYPVMSFSLRANIDELLFPKRPILAMDTTRFVSLTCVLLAVTYITAIAIPNIWYFFQFMGSTTIVFLSFIFPGLIILRDVHGISSTRDRIMAVLVIILAGVSSFIAIYSNLQNSRNNK